MNWETFIASNVVANLGWTLFNSLWQIFIVSVILFAVLKVLRDRAANLRYSVAVLALAFSVVLPVITFVQISKAPSNILRAGQQIDPVEREKAARSGLSNTELVADDEHPASIGTTEYGTSAIFSRIRAYMSRQMPQLLPLTVGLWLLGVAFFSFRLGGGLWQLRRYKTHGVDAVDDHWQDVFLRLCDRLDISRPIGLLRSAIVQTPIVIGVFKPLIILPASIFLQISPRELETIIAHELIHVRRYDPLVNIAQSVIEVLFFFHPGVWWISAQIRREREFAADEAVLQLFECSHVVYASALANLEEIRHLANQQTPRYATAANGGNLMQRIQRILKIKTEVNRANSAWTAGLALLLTSAVLLTVFSFNSAGLVNAQGKGGAKKLAIGFVSIPPVDRTDNAPKDADATARLLIATLKKHKVPAIGFLQGGMISDGEKFLPVRADIARMWKDAGFEIGLGGFKHIWLYNTPVDEYIANIEKNEAIAKKLIGDQGLPPRYFSYPYLNTGKSAEDKAKVEAWLASRGYTSVKYTIDNNEWMYSFAYDTVRNDNDVNTMREIRESYLAYMSKMFDHFEAYSREMFGRDIPQTMVLTPSRLITDTADEFFAMVAKRGYSYVTVDEAQSDEAYKTAENFAGEAGISWFERWAMAKKQTLRDEPRVDASVGRIWQARAKK